MSKRRTDWNNYYLHPYKTAILTRKITASRLIRQIHMHSTGKKPLVVAELGGGNSCFFRDIKTEIKPNHYYIIDNNTLSLERLRPQVINDPSVTLIKQDILDMDVAIVCDLVFSVGLIEHFSPENTERVIVSHFNLLKPSGIAIMTFPTPTFLYRLVRMLAELLGVWIFHDERPLQTDEVVHVAQRFGNILHSEIIWPIFLTQGLVTVQKR